MLRQQALPQLNHDLKSGATKNKLSLIDDAASPSEGLSVIKHLVSQLNHSMWYRGQKHVMRVCWPLPVNQL
ncbi:Secondary metabolism regulator LAE1 [Fusarium oxysporum f. sp. albedinis]|nr:Secondary metabolism regulator LAE1 [Fusarium oxysporum f. sp. albedinis]